MNGRPCKSEDGAGEGSRDERVERADAICERVGNETAKDGPGVEDGHEVERKRPAGTGLEEGIGRDVEEGGVDAQEAEEKRGAT